jgi:hypothetical protein
MRSSVVLSALAPLVLVGPANGVPHVKRDLAQTIWNDIVHAADCTGCQVVLTALKGLADLGTIIFVDTLTEICNISGVSKRSRDCDKLTKHGNLRKKTPTYAPASSPAKVQCSSTFYPELTLDPTRPT